MLAPHDRVDRELGAGRAAAEDLADRAVLVVGHAELVERLRLLGRRFGVLDGVDCSREALRRGTEEEAEAVGAGAGERVDGVLGVRHQADDVAGRVGDAGDVAVAAVRVAVR